MQEIEKLEGWKALCRKGDLLYSPNGDYLWPPGEPMVATCTRGGGVHMLEAPQAHCTCGIYAAWAPHGAMPYLGVDDGSRVLCKVRVPAGCRAFAGEDAWRARAAEIEAVIALGSEDAFALAPVAGKYRVPLLFWPEGRQYMAERFPASLPPDPERSLKYFDERAKRRAKQAYDCKDCGIGIIPGDMYYSLSMSNKRRRYCGDCGAKLRLLYVRSFSDWDKAGRPKKWNMSLHRYRKEVSR